jgi:hypothetical protein
VRRVPGGTTVALAPGVAPIDALSLIWLISVAALAAVLGRPAVMLGAATLAAFIVITVRRSPRGEGWRLAHDCGPIFVVLGGYFLVGPVIEARNAGSLDHTLAGIDARFFPGMLASGATCSDVRPG